MIKPIFAQAMQGFDPLIGARLAEDAVSPVVWMVTVELQPAEIVAGEAEMVNPPGNVAPPARVTVPAKP